jgi:hypothetical protein
MPTTNCDHVPAYLAVESLGKLGAGVDNGRTS